MRLPLAANGKGASPAGNAVGDFFKLRPSPGGGQCFNDCLSFRVETALERAFKPRRRIKRLVRVSAVQAFNFACFDLGDLYIRGICCI